MILQELYLCYKDLRQYVDPREAGRTDPVPHLPVTCKDLLLQLLELDPPLGYAIIEQLTFKDNPSLSHHNEQLQSIHLECLFSVLSTLKKAVGDGGEEMQRTPGSLVKHLLHLLALFKPRQEMKNLQLKVFLQELSAFLSSKQTVISLNRVYSALLGRETTYLIEVFCEVDHQYRMQQRQNCERDIQGCMLSDIGHRILSLCQDDKRKQSWRDLFLTSLKHEKHFLDLIMVRAIRT